LREKNRYANLLLKRKREGEARQTSRGGWKGETLDYLSGVVSYIFYESSAKREKRKKKGGRGRTINSRANAAKGGGTKNATTTSPLDSGEGGYGQKHYKRGEKREGEKIFSVIFM